MGDVAAAVLAAQAQKEKQLPSISVEKPIELELDLGNMLAVDNNQMENDKLADKETREAYLKTLARDNTQLLINSMWCLPTHRVEEVVVAELPPPSTRLPREKPLPTPKPMTKWEQYAKEKGIVNKKKKDRLVWDDVVNKWVPQFGFKKKQAEDEKNWCIPIKETADPNLTPFDKMDEDKKERKAKNELQRLRNLAKAKNVNVPTVGVVTPSASNTTLASNGASGDLKSAAEIAKSSTASLGKFQPKLTKSLEKGSKPKGKKRKFESNTMDSNLEKERNLGILESITNKQPRLDINMAVGKQINEEETERADEKKQQKGKGKKKGGRGGKGGGGGKKGAKGSFGGAAGKRKGKSFGGGGGGGGKKSFASKGKGKR
eukprot:TRINITY_DN693_c0_g1_i4.p1 TRINITY_DN693_c0_g1~~TRINITY_DN693_c0_g1_i4.p1  ORF type:complete len:375 (-),score=143.58 TRINITY_DN693_c0_g1_i4:144-1268(-)